MSLGDGRDGKLRMAMAKGRLSGKLAQMSLPRQIASIATWPFLEQLLSFFCAAVALFLAGHMDIPAEETPHVISGLGVAGTIMWLGFLMQAGVATGATALVSRSFGARQFEEANYNCNQAAILGAMAGTASTILMLVSARFLLGTVLELSSQALDAAMQYIHVAAWIAVCSGAVFALNASLRGAGDTRTPFFLMLLIDGLTIVLSYLFITYCGMGIEGLGWGALIPWVIGVSVLFFHLNRARLKQERARQDVPLDEYCAQQGQDYAPALALNIGRLRPDWAVIRRIVEIGLPQALEVGAIWAIQFYGLRLITSLGTVAVGAHTVAIRIESLSFLPGFAIGVAGSALVGQYLGSGSVRMATETVKRCVLIALVFMGTMGILFASFPYFFAGIFVGEAGALQDSVVDVLRVLVIAEPLFAAVLVLRMCLRGAGDTKRVMWVSFGCMGFFRIIVQSIWYYGFPDTFSLVGVWMLYNVDLCIQAVILWWMIKGLKWSRKMRV
ncbi:MAG: MATE family efflux transporter [Akkermansia sp.]